MRIQFLGSGSQCDLATNNLNSNLLLTMTDSDRALLIDCGTDIKHGLAFNDLHFDIITDVYISHLHADHVGGLEWLCFLKQYSSAVQKKLKLWISEDLVEPLWENSLKGGLEYLTVEEGALDVFFDVFSVALGGEFEWQGARFSLIPIKHIVGPVGVMPCYGLFIEWAGNRIFFTSDTQYDPDHLQPYYNRADIIFHDCETVVHPTGVHANFNELRQLDYETKSKMWLYHYSSGKLPDLDKGDGFKGFVKTGQIFDFSNG